MTAVNVVMDEAVIAVSLLLDIKLVMLLCAVSLVLFAVSASMVLARFKPSLCVLANAEFM